ncbi:MAG TPA: hypothetical protein VGP62_28095 [Bryobacteraceae bacterium]|jgi:hypothetical protein|nr:hypothetical protein [Bryobacteraceae bacterium]
MTSLDALLGKLIDYAGLYPPASLPLPAVIQNYNQYLASKDNWILNRLVLAESKLNEVQLGPNWHITLLTDQDPGRLPRQIETLETKGSERLSLPTYCEAQLDRITDAFAKIRTGGLTEDATPSAPDLADFLHQAAARRIPFKATAGLHHAIRAHMHGFVNVFVAAAFAWHGMDRESIILVLEESHAPAFEFSEHQLAWRGLRLSTGQIYTARRDFAHSFGSCSFEEPLEDLKELGWL